MGKYSSYVKEPSADERAKKTVHPIWRGVGFLLAIIVPIFSYIASVLILQENSAANWFSVPAEVLSPWGPDPYIFLKLIITIFLIILISGVFMFITFLTNSLFGPPRYGPHDSPPLQRGEMPRYSRPRR